MRSLHKFISDHNLNNCTMWYLTMIWTISRSLSYHISDFCIQSLTSFFWTPKKESWAHRMKNRKGDFSEDFQKCSFFRRFSEQRLVFLGFYFFSVKNGDLLKEGNSGKKKKKRTLKRGRIWWNLEAFVSELSLFLCIDVLLLFYHVFWGPSFFLLCTGFVSFIYLHNAPWILLLRPHVVFNVLVNKLQS